MKRFQNNRALNQRFQTPSELFFNYNKCIFCAHTTVCVCVCAMVAICVDLFISRANFRHTQCAIPFELPVIYLFGKVVWRAAHQNEVDFASFEHVLRLRLNGTVNRKRLAVHVKRRRHEKWSFVCREDLWPSSSLQPSWNEMCGTASGDAENGVNTFRSIPFTKAIIKKVLTELQFF